MAPYVPTAWVNYQAPALSAANLNKLTAELRSQASARGIGNSLPTWTDNTIPALTEAIPWNEMERVAQAVAVSLSASYTPTVWQAGWQPGRNAANLNKLEQRAVANRVLIDQAPPPPSNRYTDINFAAGLYSGEGITECLECAATEPRLDQTWGGRESYIYDNPAAYGLGGSSMTTDQNQRVHLFHPSTFGLPGVQGSTWASWQELRPADGPWGSFATNLAKASLNLSGTATWGSGGFSFGITRWFAFDILFPLNINGASFEMYATDFQTLGDIHAADSAVSRDPGIVRVMPTGGSTPKSLQFAVCKQTDLGIPYFTVDLLQLTDASGNKIASAYNVWHEVVFGQRTAFDGVAGSSSGWIEVWFNGVQRQAQASMPQYMSDEGGPYFQLQNYTRYPTSYLGGATRSAIVYGGFRAGLARSDVQTR